MRRPSPAERTLLPRHHSRPGWQEDQTFALPAQGQPEDPTLERKGTPAIHSLILPDQHPRLPLVAQC
jgi:hypothetical protein